MFIPVVTIVTVELGHLRMETTRAEILGMVRQDKMSLKATRRDHFKKIEKAFASYKHQLEFTVLDDVTDMKRRMDELDDCMEQMEDHESSTPLYEFMLKIEACVSGKSDLPLLLLRNPERHGWNTIKVDQFDEATGALTFEDPLVQDFWSKAKDHFDVTPMNTVHVIRSVPKTERGDLFSWETVSVDGPINWDACLPSEIDAAYTSLIGDYTSVGLMDEDSFVLDEAPVGENRATTGKYIRGFIVISIKKQ